MDTGDLWGMSSNCVGFEKGQELIVIGGAKGKGKTRLTLWKRGRLRMYKGQEVIPTQIIEE